jgi:hypothetical protein
MTMMTASRNQSKRSVCATKPLRIGWPASKGLRSPSERLVSSDLDLIQ